MTEEPDTTTAINAELFFKELKASDMGDQLDASGKIIEKTGQRIEQESICIAVHDNHGKYQAIAIITPAEKSQFQYLTQLNKKFLINAIYLNSVWLSPDVNESELMPALLYLALRRARIMGKQSVATLMQIPNVDYPIVSMLHLDRLQNVEQFHIGDKVTIAFAQRINYAMYCVFQYCEGSYLKLIKNNFVNEILDTHQQWLDRFYQGAWCRAVIEGELSKEQYISTLFNLYQYVRQTTRLAARCVAHSADLSLRNHYLNHLMGEINHELIIEHDLKKLKADIEYLKNSYVPLAGTKEFMVVQESTIGFYQDPVLMLACPLAAEGVAAHMSPEFLEKLYQAIAKWGVEEPQSAARFLSSHVNTDGGDDGHWNHVVNMLARCITDEYTQQRFLSVLMAAMNAFEKSFNDNVNNLKLWSATKVDSADVTT